MADLDLIERIYDAVPPLGEMTFARFRHAWSTARIGHVLLVRCDEEDPLEFISDIYARLTTRLGTVSEGTNAAEAETILLSDVATRIWTLYALYTIHECQITRRKHKIVLPKCECARREASVCTPYSMQRGLRTIEASFMLVCDCLAHIPPLIRYRYGAGSRCSTLARIDCMRA
jgi:hypothetical protein